MSTVNIFLTPGVGSPKAKHLEPTVGAASTLATREIEDGTGPKSENARRFLHRRAFSDPIEN